MSIKETRNRWSFAPRCIIIWWIVLQEPAVAIITAFYSLTCNFKAHGDRPRSFVPLHAVESNHLRSNLDDMSHNRKKRQANCMYSNRRYCTKLNRRSDLHLYNNGIVENNARKVCESPRKNGIRMQLLRPLEVMTKTRYTSTSLEVSSGLTFDDGEQLLVSAQKPLGILLEERSGREGGGCIVVQVTSGSVADRSGIRKGDVLIAVQNLNVEQMKLEDVMEKIASAPKVVNLRFWRGDI